jgi:hypothetical protein
VHKTKSICICVQMLLFLWKPSQSSLRNASSPERENFISILRRDKKLPPRGSWRVSA